jgi:putative membrane protein
MTVVLERIRNHGDDIHHSGGHWWWWLIALAVLALLVVAILALLTYRPATSERPRTSPEPPRGSAEQILADRFARGEIDADEYRQRRDALRQ